MAAPVPGATADREEPAGRTARDDRLGFTNTSSRSGFSASDEGKIEQQLAQEASLSVAAQQRIIVRNVDLVMVVDDLTGGLDSVNSVAVQFGGWVVSSRRDQRNQASMSIRVPAERVDEALARLRSLAQKVESEISISQDFTDEYIDTQARVKNLQATEAQLVELLARAEDVEAALKVQAELTRTREQIEKSQGRLNFLEQTSAFSLINVVLKLGPLELEVDAGPDQTVREGQPVSFRASFVPPEGVTDFTYEWDFGNDTRPVTGERTALNVDGISRTTATVTHAYPDHRDSPFIVTFKVTGAGEAGVAEGRDTMIVTVVEIPNIEVYAGPDLTISEGEPASFSGSFTRPEGLTDFNFRWEFGDGSAPVTGDLPEGITNASADHSYPDARPQPFTTTLTVTASSEAGEITGSDTILIRVTGATPWSADWNASGTLRDAVRTLSFTGRALGMVGIWLAIFSPFWLAGLALVYVRRRRTNGRGRDGGN